MTAVAGSLWNLQQNRIEEVLNKNIDMIMPSLDPIWRDTMVTSQGVASADAIGRDMLVKKNYHGSFTGVIEQAAPRNDFVLYGDDTDIHSEKLHTQNLNQTFPEPFDGANASPYQFAVFMRAMVSNLMLTLGELQAEATPAFIGEIVAPKLTGFARHWAHTLSVYWYLSQNSNYRLCAITNVTSPSGSGTAYLFSFKPDNQAIDRFWTGQRLDIFDSTGATRQNETGADVRQSLWVSHVDETTNTVTCTAPADPSTWDGGDPVNGDIVTYANSQTTSGDADTFTGIAGYRSYLKYQTSDANEKYLLGPERVTGWALDVGLHPEHKSFYKDLSGAVLTEHTLRKYLRRWHAAKAKYGHYIDCLFASDGVWMAYEATKIGRELLDRTNRLSSLSSEGSGGGKNFDQGFNFTMDGRTYMGYTSTYIESGTVVGLRKGGNNYKRYVPPDPKGVKNMDRMEPFIPFKFVGPALTGTSSMQLPIYDSSGTGNFNAVTEGVQLPGMMRMQLCPDQFDGMILDNVGEEREYSD
jgi:hypothetical protein